MGRNCGQPRKSVFKILFTFYKQSGIMEKEPQGGKTMAQRYDKETGLPVDRTYLECGLPPYLQRSLDTMKRAWEAEDNGANDLHFDAYYCELQADINSAEVEGEISSEQAWYLRETYLRIQRGVI